MQNKCYVTIFCIVYNSRQYIQQCLDAFLKQKTNYKFEIVIHDDASTDGTKEIIENYSKKYPDIIRPFYEEENQYSKGNITKIIKELYKKSKGKYLAQCDGDDYWCDEYKLQKQVDFMEAHPDYVLCYHPAKMIYVDEEREPVIIGKSTYKNPQSYYKLIKANNIPSSSVMYRTEYLKKELLDYPECIYPGDWFTHISVAKHGKIGYLPDIMHVYRWHSQGISHTNSDNPVEEIHLKYGIKEVNFSYEVWNRIKDQFPQYYEDVFINILKDVYFAYLKALKFKEINILTDIYSNYFKDFEICAENKELSKYKKKHKKYKKLFNTFLIVSIVLLIICIFLCIYFGIKCRSSLW